MDEFHFIRPLWLLVLPVALALAWRAGLGRGGRGSWRNVVDRALQPHVLTDGDAIGRRRLPLLAALAASVFAAIALAGPTWDRLPVPAFRSDDALVVALDLSQSMEAADVEPSRLARARLKLLDLLERRPDGQTALVVFTSNAFTVTPLTNDTRTIAALVNALSTDIMPSRGSVVEAGLEKAASLLRQTGARGEILLMTDAVASPRAIALAGQLAAEGIETHVLGVGTEEGAPIPRPEGGFLTDATGKVVIPALNVDNLQRLARAGGGRFARLAASDADLDRLFPDELAAGLFGELDEAEREADIWRDQGIWLVLALLPLIALAFRRGWIYLVVGGVVLQLPEAHAFEWSELWLNRDQQGLRAMESGAPAEAAALFEDPEWLAAARYRAGEFDASAEALAALDTPDANYNRGNALARAGRLAEAIAAYDRTLELAPDHADAEFNRSLVEDLLEQQQEQQQQQQSDSQQESGDGAPEQSDEGREQTAANEESGSEEQPNAEAAQAETDESSGQNPSSDSPPEPAEPELADAEPPEAGDAEEPGEAGETPLQAAASPEDVDDWADEQAADQWLRRIPQDPGGLLRRKFLYQYQQQGRDQDGNPIFRGSEAEPW